MHHEDESASSDETNERRDSSPSYEPPALTEHGDLKKIIQSGPTGGNDGGGGFS
jgi:hypothetical protein